MSNPVHSHPIPTLADQMMRVLDRLGNGESFNDVVENTGITALVCKAQREEALRVGGTSDAKQFFDELLDAHETLLDIGHTHGQRTLVDLFYLLSAIVQSSYVDWYPEESRILDVVQELPSAEKWMQFIKIESVLES